MEETIRQLIERGSIKVSDNISFRTKAECASLFGRNYSNILRGGISHPKEEESQMIFWQEEENDGWENEYTFNEKKEIIKFTERRKHKHKEWVSERLKIADTRIKNNLIFYKLKGEEYKFRGVFQIDTEGTISSGLLVYRRVSSEAVTYSAENKKPIKDLKGLVLSGCLKENEEIYLSYKGVEYSGRVTSNGKIRIHEGEFSVSKSALIIMKKNSECEMNFERANGYSWWKNWRGISIGELRKN